MSGYEYRVLYRVVGATGWTQHGNPELTSQSGGRREVDGLVNGQTYEFMVVREAPSSRESDILRGTPVAGIERPPDTFVPSGEQVGDDGGSTTGQRGFYNEDEGVLLNFTQGANWNEFDVVILSGGVESTLVRVQSSPRRYFIGGVGTGLPYAEQSLVIEVPGTSGRQFFIRTGNESDISVRPNGRSFVPFTLEIR